MGTSTGDVTQEAPRADPLQPHLWPRAPVTPVIPPPHPHENTQVN